MNPLLDQFLSEGRELIQEATHGLIALERTPTGDGVALVFRAFHTLKGSSGLFDVPPMTRMLHAAEDALSAVRAGRAAINASLIDLLLESLDRTAAWLDALEAQGGLPADADAAASDLIDRLRGAVMGDGGPAEAPATPTSNDLAAFTATERAAALDLLRQGAADASVFRIVYDPDPGCFFTGEDPLKLVSRLPGLAALRISPREDWPAPEILDPFLCNLRIDLLAVGEEEAVRHPFRLVADQVRVSAVDAEILGPEPARPRPPADLVSAVLAEQRRLLAGATPEGEVAGRWGSAAAAAANALRHGGRADLADDVGAALVRSVELRDPAPLAEALDLAVRARQSAARERDVDSSPAPLPPSRQLRVDEARIDRLFALVGEMIVAKNSLGWLAGQAALPVGSGDIVRPLRDLHAAMDRLVRDMHDAMVRIRMVPVGQVFDRFPRYVRDQSIRLGKPVDLVIEGEETSADKTVVDTLYEPLLHLVRNSLDHGIELPEERRRHSKPDRATLTLRAFHSNDRIVVEVGDDGRGIDIANVGRQAVQADVIDEAQLAALGDAETSRLIFTPGLSTAEETSDLSGRGMGMFAVRLAVERLGGGIAVETARHRGTNIRLELPLTLALLRIVTVEAGGRRFGVPLDDVAEMMRLPEDRVGRIKAQWAFAWRDQVVPLHSLAGLLDLGDDLPAPSEARMVLVVRTKDGVFGLAIDGIGERLEVVLRPMDGVLADIPAYLGTTLQGDGRVLLVLNLKEILP
ncbi:chemotaxis protein CheA [Skermanella mucosa]|uniref:chemotaxis protein CheA n=1 Tax=Skermanella mucosa TaxID=1789672 RepID=UPI00192C4486|nr:chemotaxis protein CheA [Skermanella mucosa]UEM23701.1 chemotaxis protein CheA [Skermanella mucosa]